YMPSGGILHRARPRRRKVRRRDGTLLLHRGQLRAARASTDDRAGAGGPCYGGGAGVCSGAALPHLPAVRAAHHHRDALFDPGPGRRAHRGRHRLAGPAVREPMTTSQRRATIIDVAKRAGVSRQTVTRAVHDMPGISPATRGRALAAARELDYRPSRLGRGLVEQGPVTLGLAVHDLSNSYSAELGAAFVRAGAPHGWNVVLAETEQARR